MSFPYACLRIHVHTRISWLPYLCAFVWDDIYFTYLYKVGRPRIVTSTFGSRALSDISSININSYISSIQHHQYNACAWVGALRLKSLTHLLSPAKMVVGKPPRSIRTPSEEGGVPQVAIIIVALKSRSFVLGSIISMVDRDFLLWLFGKYGPLDQRMSGFQHARVQDCDGRRGDLPSYYQLWSPDINLIV